MKADDASSEQDGVERHLPSGERRSARRREVALWAAWVVAVLTGPTLALGLWGAEVGVEDRRVTTPLAENDKQEVLALYLAGVTAWTMPWLALGAWYAQLTSRLHVLAIALPVCGAVAAWSALPDSPRNACERVSSMVSTTTALTVATGFSFAAVCAIGLFAFGRTRSSRWLAVAAFAVLPAVVFVLPEVAAACIPGINTF